jgi:uncharacterized membrane protein HdeD (DUF308 family)
MRREFDALTWGWWLALLIGVLAIIAGIIVILKPSDSLSTIAVIVGIFILVDGIVALIGAVSGDIESRGLLAVVGALSAIAGVLLIRHPLGGVRAVALVFGIWLIAVGVARFVTAFADDRNRFWRILVALILVVFGIAIVAEPNIGFTTLAVIAGISLIAYGVGMLGLGWALHAVRHSGSELEQDMEATRRPDAGAMT